MDQTRHGQWRNRLLACALLAAALPPLARVVAGPPGADIQVEWKASVDEPTRVRAETQLRLTDPRKLADTYTWRYDLVDTSSDHIRAVVQHPAIEDTQEIERNTFTLEPTAPRTLRRQRFDAGDLLVSTADALALVLLAAALISATGRSPIALLQRGIPHLDARTAGLFRLIFGGVVLAFLASRRVDASWLTVTFDLEVDGPLHRAVLDWLRRHPNVVNGVTPWILITGAAFTAGLFTRVTYALFVAGALVWAYVAMSVSSTHPYASFMLMLVVLLPSRWGDALSVDAWMRRRRGQPAATATGLMYGYSVWVPGLVLGVAFAAAAWAKLTVPPGVTDWVLNGTVKYHFITDSVSAPVDWGLELARHPSLAVAASLMVIAVEALVITAAFVRNEWYRLAMGAGALGLLAGFELFMGVFWPGWWIQLLGFLPWQHLATALKPGPAKAGHYVPPGPAEAGHYVQRIPEVRIPEVRSVRLPRPAYVYRGGQADLPSPAKAGHYVLIVFVITQQVVVSSLRLERPPMFSWYDMYSTTYASEQAWAERRAPVYRIVASTDRGPVEVRQCDGQPPHDEFVRKFEQALDGTDEARASVWQDLRACGEAFEQASSVTLEGDMRVFDWDTLQFATTPNAVTVGPLVRGQDDRQDSR